jgi:plastocyanin
VRASSPRWRSSSLPSYAPEQSDRVLASVQGIVQAKLLVILALVGVLLGVGLGSARGSRADNPQLIGDVGQGDSFAISLKDASGNAVKHLDRGTYTLILRDHSAIHNFDLNGPGVSASTDITAIEDKTLTITLTDGTYFFVCDAHAAQMKGSFTVGNVTPTTTTTTTTTSTPPPPAAAAKLTGAIGPGTRLSLRPTSGLAAGKAKLTISDATATDGFKLSGPGVARSTGVAFKGKVTWTVTLKAGTYTYSSIKHPARKHTFRISS